MSGALVIVRLVITLQVVPGMGPENPIVEGAAPLFAKVKDTGPVAVQTGVPASLTTRPFTLPVPPVAVADVTVKVAASTVTAGQRPGPVLVPPVIVPPAAPAGSGGVGSAGPVLPLRVKVQFKTSGVGQLSRPHCGEGRAGRANARSSESRTRHADRGECSNAG